jgi:uncharacterized membrane-anchored protein YitT (DUF2179 family)
MTIELIAGALLLLIGIALGYGAHPAFYSLSALGVLAIVVDLVIGSRRYKVSDE